MKEPIFLICTERSGSNLLTRIMDGHPDICGPAPTHLFRLFFNNRENYGDLTREQNWRTLVEDFVLNFNSKLGVWSVSVSVDELLKHARTRSLQELFSLTYGKEAAFHKAQWAFIKENQTYTFAPRLLECFPNCRFVYMVRDPRDVANSWVNNISHQGGVERAVEVWMNDQTGTKQLLEKDEFKQRTICTSYEQLVLNTNYECSRILQSLGLKFDKSMLQFHENENTLKNAARVEAWNNLKNPVLRNNIGKHMALLEKTEIQYIESICGSLMRDLGYRLNYFDVGEAQKKQNILLSKDELSGPDKLEQSVSPDESALRAQRLSALEVVLNRRL